MMKTVVPPRIYVVEANGLALVAFEAFTRIEATELPKEQWFRDELLFLRSETRQIWDGKTSLAVRRAEEIEISEFKNAQTGTAHNAADGIFLAYLIPLDGPA